MRFATLVPNGTTHDAAEHAVRLAEQSARERVLFDALQAAEFAAIEAQAVLSRCLHINDKPIIERACGVLSRSVATSHVAICSVHAARKEG